jgi:type IV pilus assembly protein PilV
MQGHQRRQIGSSLIEVMVAMLLSSIGLLAMSGLLASSARLSKAGEYRALANLLAEDIIERMRANLAGQAAYGLTPSALADSPASAGSCVNTEACTPAEVANMDLAEWRNTLFNSLPNGTGYLSVTDATNRLVDVWIIWRDPSALSGTGYDNPAEGSDSHGRQRSACPPGFAEVGRPRCLYFRVGL